MAITAPAPTFYFNNIIFNSSFYPSTLTSGITQTQADARYLIKISSDTATSSENFNLGLTSLNVEPTAITGNLTIAGTQTTGNLVIGGNQTSGNISIGYNASAGLSNSGSVTIGTRNAYSNTTTNINSGLGGLTLMSDGLVNIDSSANLNIGASTVGIITIGQNSNRTNDINIGYFTSSYANLTGGVNIGTWNTLGAAATTINAGTGGLTQQSVGNMTITSSALLTQQSVGNMSLYSASGNLTIGGTSNNASGTIAIGSSITRTGAINIGYVTASALLTGAINIGTFNTLGASTLGLYSGTGGTNIQSAGNISLSPNGYSQISKLQANSIDSIASGALTIGGANATSIVLGGSAATSVSFGSGVTNLQLSANEFIGCGANTSISNLLSSSFPYIGSYNNYASTSSGNLTSGSQNVITSGTISTVGVYMANWSYQLSNGASSTLSTYRTGFVAPAGTYYYIYDVLGPTTATTSSFYVSGMCVFPVTTASTSWTLFINPTFSGGSWTIGSNNYGVKLYRIA